MTVKIEVKAALGVELKDAEKGEVLVRFAKLGVVDYDGDWTDAGAFGRQKVLVSTYNHGTSLNHQSPVGSGMTHEEGDFAVAELRYFLGKASGREEFDTVKLLLADGLGEWSYRYQVQISARPTEEQRQKGVFRVLKKVKVIHVAPVEVGAGIGTATLAAKAAREAGEDPALTNAVQRAAQKDFNCPFPFPNFDACVARMSAEEGVDDPAAVCGAWEHECGKQVRDAAIKELARFERTRARLLLHGGR